MIYFNSHVEIDIWRHKYNENIFQTSEIPVGEISINPSVTFLNKCVTIDTHVRFFILYKNNFVFIAYSDQKLRNQSISTRKQILP